MTHFYQPGEKFHSPGGQFTYQVIGPVCRLYDREELPYPSCSLQWISKQPSWRRIGRRFVPDISAKQRPSYCVQMVEHPNSQPFVMTLFWQKLTPEQQNWWYVKRLAVVKEIETVAEVAA